MGIVLKQSLQNTAITYIGFGIGAINTLFLYTNFLSTANYGLVNVIISIAVLLTPLMAFGVPNTMIKYYSSFKQAKETNGFLTLMLILPLVLMFPIAGVCYFFYELIGDFLAIKNPIVKGYVWYIYIIGLAMAYFEIFYSWSRVQMKSVFGNFMKEVFMRLGVMILLVLVYAEILSVPAFLKALVSLYLLRTLIMKVYAYSTRPPKLNFKFPKNSGSILRYTTLIILGGSIAVVLLEVDKFMLNQYVTIENVAYYSVAGFIAIVIGVPARAMHQITYPLTAELMNANDKEELKKLYQKSSLTLGVIAGLLFLLIILNLKDLYTLLPEGYNGGFYIVFLLGIAKVYDSFLGNTNAILYNSEYYRAVLFMGLFLAVCTVLFNLWFIPMYGLDGAAIATLIAIALYNTAKLGYVRAKFKIQPFTRDTLKILGVLFLLGMVMYSISFSFHPILNIALKSMLISAVYVFILYRFNISEDVNGLIRKYILRK